MNLALLPIFLALGGFVGFLAGLLGIGGGFTIVPVLLEIFSRMGFATEHLVSMAIGTSAGTIIFTGISSTRAHHAKGAVSWPIVLAMSPGLVVGSLLGPQIASNLPAATMPATVPITAPIAAMPSLPGRRREATGGLLRIMR